MAGCEGCGASTPHARDVFLSKNERKTNWSVGGGLGSGTNGLLSSRSARMASGLAWVECGGNVQTAAVILGIRHSAPALNLLSTRPSGTSWYYVLGAGKLNVWSWG